MSDSRIVIQPSKISPFVEVSNNNQSLIIRGNSFVLNPRSFYEEVLSWADTVKLPAGEILTIELTPGYYSTSNMQVLNLIFKALAANNPGALDVTIFIDKDEEEDMEDLIFSLTFNVAVTPVIKYINEEGN